MGAYTQTNGSSMPVSTGGKGTSMSMPAAWNHPSQQSGFGNDYGGGPITPQQRALWANRPQQVGPDRLDTPANIQAVNAAVQTGQSLPSTGGKGTSQAVGSTVGSMQPVAQMPPQQNYAYQQQPAWMSALASILQRQQPAFQYQAPNYAQMQQQALPQGWPTPPPMYTPPPPPAAAPPQDTERRMAEMQARINQLTEQQARPHDPAGSNLFAGNARGGRIKRKTGERAKPNIVEQALAVTRRK